MQCPLYQRGGEIGGWGEGLGKELVKAVEGGVGGGGVRVLVVCRHSSARGRRGGGWGYRGGGD